MKKIMIDMDDVICGGGFIALINEFLGTSYKEEEMKSYYIQDIIPAEKAEEWKVFFESKNLYDYTYLLPDAYEVMEKLSKKYELYVLTAYIFKDDASKSAEHLKNKFKYLIETFPFINPDNYIFTSRKDAVSADIRIDDRVPNLKCDGEKKLLFSAYHNLEISDEELKKDGIIRVNNWKEIEKMLM